MRTALALVAATLLAGCASSALNEGRSGQPDRIFNSTKDVAKVAECVQFTWQDEASFGVDASGYLEQAGGVVTVRFADGVERRLILEYAPLERI